MFKLNNQDPSTKHLVGKQISVDVDGENFVGVLTWCGWNEKLNRFQITLNKLPLVVSKSDFSKIELFKGRLIN